MWGLWSSLMRLWFKHMCAFAPHSRLVSSTNFCNIYRQHIGISLWTEKTHRLKAVEDRKQEARGQKMVAWMLHCLLSKWTWPEKVLRSYGHKNISPLLRPWKPNLPISEIWVSQRVKENSDSDKSTCSACICFQRGDLQLHNLKANCWWPWRGRVSFPFQISTSPALFFWCRRSVSWVQILDKNKTSLSCLTCAGILGVHLNSFEPKKNVKGR